MNFEISIGAIGPCFTCLQYEQENYKEMALEHHYTFKCIRMKMGKIAEYLQICNKYIARLEVKHIKKGFMELDMFHFHNSILLHFAMHVNVFASFNSNGWITANYLRRKTKSAEKLSHSARKTSKFCCRISKYCENFNGIVSLVWLNPLSKWAAK